MASDSIRGALHAEAVRAAEARQRWSSCTPIRWAEPRARLGGEETDQLIAEVSSAPEELTQVITEAY